MAAYAEGLNILRGASVREAGARRSDAETTPLRDPEHYQYDFDLAEIAEAVAAGQRHRLVAARPDRGRARSRTPGSSDFAGPRLRLGRGALDHPRRDRRGRAGARADRRALPALLVARRGRLRRQGALRHALRVRRPRREEAVSGPTGVGRARLLRRDRRPRLQEDLPGAARDGPARATSTCRSSASPGAAGRSSSSQRARRRASSGTAASTAAPSRSCAACCATCDGDYDDAGHLQGAEARARRRAAPGALPRDPARHVRPGGRSSSARRAAPTGRASSSRSRSAATSRRPGSSTGIAAPVLRRERRLPHRPLPRQGGRPEPALLPVRQHLPRADLEPQLRRERPDHDGGGLRRRGARRVLRARPARSATWSRTTCSRSLANVAMEPPAQRGHRERARREGEGAEGDPAARPAGPRPRPVPRLPRASPASRPTRPSRRSRRCGSTIDSWRWQGVPFFIRAGKCLPVTCTEVVVTLRRPPHGLRGGASRPTTSASALGPDVTHRARRHGQAARRGGRGRRGRAAGQPRDEPGRGPTPTSSCSATRMRGRAVPLRPRGLRRGGVAHRRSGAEGRAAGPRRTSQEPGGQPKPPRWPRRVAGTTRRRRLGSPGPDRGGQVLA